MSQSYSFTIQEKEKLKEPIVSNFLKEEANHQKLKAFIESPNQETKHALDSAFRIYYKRVKVIAYIDKLIHYYSMDLDKRNNKHYANHQLILDKPIGEDGNTTLIDIIASEQHPALHPYRFSLEELLEDLNLYKAWNTLSDKQKEVLTLKYQYNLKDVDIAEVLSESKQVISYNHNKAIIILRRSVKDN
ncbi:hypothetical protein [Oceanobacillus sp. FSL H7-0719]|uniref:hypothetical protein n=1 Tax=Oceanobacillus sp. FSL H7-0719 TaxID=2954507 RepID=UPI0032538556